MKVIEEVLKPIIEGLLYDEDINFLFFDLREDEMNVKADAAQGPFGWLELPLIGKGQVKMNSVINTYAVRLCLLIQSQFADQREQRLEWMRKMHQAKDRLNLALYEYDNAGYIESYTDFTFTEVQDLFDANCDGVAINFKLNIDETPRIVNDPVKKTVHRRTQ